MSSLTTLNGEKVTSSFPMNKPIKLIFDSLEYAHPLTSPKEMNSMKPKY